ncbi:MAG: pentapeptide repeat-containing protein [Gammaproteobacteria bacterium]|nr:pentapeptide repeat-containing protein [Gammaproteobacteria bacterium]MCB1881524.1 pentapeptide repeat-containing protein [Gammaproteobacteria bacterium]
MNDRRLPRFLIRDTCQAILENNKGIDAVLAWNQWRLENPEIKPLLSDLDLSSLDLGGMVDVGGEEEDSGAYEFRGIDFGSAILLGTNLRKTVLRGANFSGADLREADFTGANLTQADFTSARLDQTVLNDADLTGANLGECNLEKAKLRKTRFNLTQLNDANLREADLYGARVNGSYLNGANLESANLSHAHVCGANLSSANLINADLSHARIENTDLTQTMLVHANIDHAQFVDCRIFGLSIWDLKGNPALTQGLIISPEGEAPVKVDNLEAAQLQYVLLGNYRTGKVIDSVIRSSVLILGRFGHRKPVLDSIRLALRAKGYIPIIFDFESPEERSLTESITLLAHLARFIIADLTDPASIPQELESIIPQVEVVVQPLIEGNQPPYSMSRDFVTHYRNQFLPLYRYKDVKELIDNIEGMVLAPAEARREAIIKERAQAEKEWE